MITTQEATKLWELVEPLKTGMLVTCASPNLHARPMQLVQTNFTGEFYFFTDLHSFKVEEIKENPHVCVTFSCPKQQTYVSVSGYAASEHNQALINQFWNPFVSAWFPQGKDDPSIILLKIDTFQAEYWDSTNNKLVQLYQYVKAGITGRQPNMGEHGRV